MTTSREMIAVHSLTWKTEKTVSCSHTYGSCFARTKRDTHNLRKNGCIHVMVGAAVTPKKDHLAVETRIPVP